jgi:AmiR/NasT family two-component response regulator
MKQLNMNTRVEVKSLLLVDDDRLILATLSSELRLAGYQINTVETVDEAEVWLQVNERPDLVILDVRMPKRDGLELTPLLADLENIPFILLTAYSEKEVVEQANLSGAMAYLVKPVDMTQLILSIENALARAHELKALRGSAQQLQHALDTDRTASIAIGIIMDERLINHDEAMKLLRNMARSQHIKLADLAANIVSARETLNLRFNA